MYGRGIAGHLFWAVFCGIGTYIAIVDAIYIAAIFTSIGCLGNIFYAVKLIKLKQNDNTQNG